jgi:diguanylate cyclase (GGDEF)-like protein/PAS domain S-box-containing protein
VESRNVVKLPRREPPPAEEPWQAVLEQADAEIEALRAQLERERELRDDAEADARRLAAVVESSDDAIFSLSPEGRIETWNPGAERLFGHVAEDALGRPVSFVAPELEVSEALGGALERVRGGERVAGREVVALGRGERRLDVALTASPILDATGAIAGLSCVARDIGERKRFEAKLRHLADHDSVTGLANRRRFEERLSSQLSRAGRSGGAVLVLDIDDFKLINDRLGHRAGDEALGAVARVATRSVGPRAVLARLGGDEFAALLPGADAVAAESSAHALLEAVRGLSLTVDGRPVHLTASVGISLIDGERATVQELLSGADAAMYAAKEAGRDRMAMVAPGSARSAEERWGAAGLIRRALDEDRFVLHAQPIRDLRTGEVGRHEILLRLLDDDNRLLLPEAFLRSAERFGHVGAIDRWVVRRAIRLIAAAQVAGTDLCLEVNLSGRSIGDPELPRVVEAELEATGIDASRLVLEITETAAIANMEQARELATRLRSLGCRFALDDFGSGFSSFWYLKHLPLDYVKIDGEFVRNLASGPADALVVKAMVQIAQGLGLRTIAEFVENQTTLELLTELGVDYAQGDHVGSPEPALDLLGPERRPSVGRPSTAPSTQSQVTSRSSPLSTS